MSTKPIAVLFAAGLGAASFAAPAAAFAPLDPELTAPDATVEQATYYRGYGYGYRPRFYGYGYRPIYRPYAYYGGYGYRCHWRLRPTYWGGWRRVRVCW